MTLLDKMDVLGKLEGCGTHILTIQTQMSGNPQQRGSHGPQTGRIAMLEGGE